MIDDDLELCQELDEILKDEGYLVESVADGSLGKTALISNPYDLVIIDYRMPSFNGVEVLKFIKEKGLKIKVFLISGRPFVEKLLKEEGLSSLVTSVLNKPFCIKTLLDNIKRL
ncbi:MAG: response regulator [Candidatus Omnitrophota bacterium]|nr:response regulator [Candidatus Omnitrophota bacterium]